MILLLRLKPLTRLFLVLVCLLGSSVEASSAATCKDLATNAGLSQVSAEKLRDTNAIILNRLEVIAHTEIPSIKQISLIDGASDAIDRPRQGSPGLIDELIERARVLNAFPDYKPISDAVLKPLSSDERFRLTDQSRKEAEALVANLPATFAGSRALEFERQYTRLVIERLYDLDGEVLSAADKMPHAPYDIEVPQPYRDTYRYVENLWPQLFKQAPRNPKGSILETPFPFLIPAGRFNEGYYWDLYPAVRAMITTGRLEVAQMQVENLLHMVWRYGFVPNGWRDYYLSRSQPPFLSSMVREVFEATRVRDGGATSRSQEWLRQRALPLLIAEHNYWMEGARFDARTGLNHHWDDLDLPRPERHGFDEELALGETYRDTRAAAESGRDFTDAWQKRASKIAGPLLNSMLYKTELDIASLLRQIGDVDKAIDFERQAARRRNAMDRFQWNEKLGAYVNYDVEYRTQIEVLGADTAYALWGGVPNQERANRIATALQKLEAEGGLMSSVLVDSKHQWDGHHGWAPDHLVAVEGLARYGMNDQATRLARKWLDTLASIHRHYGNLPESVDVVSRDRPKIDDTKYPVQEGFLWTNATYVLFLQRLYRLWP